MISIKMVNINMQTFKTTLSVLFRKWKFFSQMEKANASPLQKTCNKQILLLSLLLLLLLLLLL